MAARQLVFLFSLIVMGQQAGLEHVGAHCQINNVTGRMHYYIPVFRLAESLQYPFKAACTVAHISFIIQCDVDELLPVATITQHPIRNFNRGVCEQYNMIHTCAHLHIVLKPPLFCRRIVVYPLVCDS